MQGFAIQVTEAAQPAVEGEPEAAVEASDLAPCPWCKQPAEWLAKVTAHRKLTERALGCGNPHCPIRPHTKWRATTFTEVPQAVHDLEAIAEWNLCREGISE